jgi:hypothetical protein
MYNGWRTTSFPMDTGLFQGSPLSPLLWVVAAQPLFSHMRRLANTGAVKAMPLPGGVTAPVCSGHADDTTLRVATPEDAKAAMDLGVQQYCRATNARVSQEKCHGMTLGCQLAIDGVDPVSGIIFPPAGTPQRHLGILLSKDPAAAAVTMWQKVLGAVRRAASR